MTKLTQPQLGIATPATQALVTALTKGLKPIVDQVNAISAGQVTATYNANTAPPTGTIVAYAKGDFVKNSNPTELGSAGSEYVILGWVCTAGGAPGTWKQCRVLTGD